MTDLDISMDFMESSGTSNFGVFGPHIFQKLFEHKVPCSCFLNFNKSVDIFIIDHKI